MAAFSLAHELGWFNVDAMLASGPAGMLAKWSNWFVQRADNGQDLEADPAEVDAMTGA